MPQVRVRSLDANLGHHDAVKRRTSKQDTVKVLSWHAVCNLSGNSERSESSQPIVIPTGASHTRREQKRSGNFMSECVLPERSWASCSLENHRDVKKPLSRTIAVSGNKRILLA